MGRMPARRPVSSVAESPHDPFQASRRNKATTASTSVVVVRQLTKQKPQVNLAVQFRRGEEDSTVVARKESTS